MARASYIGTQGRDLGRFQEIDPAIYGPGATASNTNARRPLAPTYASMIEMSNSGFSNYNALQVTVEHRFTRSLSFVANYTFSKGLDNESADVQLTVTNPDPFAPRLQLWPSPIWTSPTTSRSGRSTTCPSSSMLPSWFVPRWAAGRPAASGPGRPASPSTSPPDRIAPFPASPSTAQILSYPTLQSPPRRSSSGSIPVGLRAGSDRDIRRQSPQPSHGSRAV